MNTTAEDLAWNEALAHSEKIARELGPEWQPEPLRPRHPREHLRAAATLGRWWVIHQPGADLDKRPESAYCALARGKYSGEGPTPRAAVEKCRAVIMRVIAEIAAIGAEIDP